MVHTSHRQRSTRHLLGGVSLGAVAACAATGAILLTGVPAGAQAQTSTAYGVSATGVESKAPQPSVSSAGAVQTASGSVSGLGWSATGITVKAGAGLAEATVGAVTVAGRSLGSVSAKCSNGTTAYTHSGAAPADPKLRVSFGGGAGATIQILGAGDTPVQTITVAVARCGAGTPPTTPTTPPTQPSGQPTSRPTGTQPPTSARQSGGARPAGGTPAQPAPAPQPRDGHHPVTG